MDITEELLDGCSPYIYNLIYDVDQRILFIECLDDPEDEEPALRIVFPEITQYQEANLLDEIDDESIDDIVSIEQVEQGKVSIVTYKKDIQIHHDGDIFIEDIVDEED